MKERLRRIARYVLVPLGYLLLLLFFVLVTFPMESLRGRILSEFERQQRIGRSPGEPVMTLEIGSLSTHWLTGVKLENLKLTVPPRTDKPKPMFPGVTGGAADAAAEGPTVVAIERFTARVQVLPLLIGRVKVDFRMNAFGGSVSGSAPYASPGNVEIEVEDVHLDQVAPLRAMVQNQPLFGVMHGTIELAPKEGKFAKADGRVDLQIDEMSMFDGESKLFGIALPPAQFGRLSLAAKAENGVLTIEELSVQGKDLELAGEGKIRLNETYKRSTADLFLKFKFTDAYRDKDDATRGLLGKPGSTFKPAIEELDPQRTFVRARTEDDFYRFHLAGRLDKLDVQPAGANAPRKAGGLNGEAGSARRSGRPTIESPSAPAATPSTPEMELQNVSPPSPPPAREMQALPPGMLNARPAQQAVDGESPATEGR